MNSLNNLKVLSVLIFAVVTVSCESGYKDINAEDEKITPSDSVFSDRTYHVFIPENYVPSGQPLPLIFAFHGAGDSGLSFKKHSGLDQEAQKINAFVVYPDAKVSNWNEGCDCNNAARLKIDDIGFVKFLIKKIKSNFKIDSTKIYAVGYSQGGLFAQYVACTLSDKFSAVATVSATFSVPLSQNCFPNSPINLLMLNGTKDYILPYLGLNDGSFSLLSANDAIRYWSVKNSCNAIANVEYLSTSSSISVRKETYANCKNNVETVIYIVEGGGHDWFIYPEIYAPKIVTEFFKNH